MRGPPRSRAEGAPRRQASDRPRARLHGRVGAGKQSVPEGMPRLPPLRRTCRPRRPYPAPQGQPAALLEPRQLDAALCALPQRMEAVSREEAEVTACRVEGCGSIANRKGACLCEAHYMRLRRTGSHELRKPKERRVHSHGYILVHAPGHPLGRGESYVYEHRAVFHAEHGDGPFTCHWCGAPVTWETMHVDHVNSVRDDNRLDNLVASCPPCNQERGIPKMRQTQRAMGHIIHHGGESLCVSEWARRIGVKRRTLHERLRAGWPVERILSPSQRNSAKQSEERRNQQKEY